MCSRAGVKPEDPDPEDSTGQQQGDHLDIPAVVARGADLPAVALPQRGVAARVADELAADEADADHQHRTPDDTDEAHHLQCPSRTRAHLRSRSADTRLLAEVALAAAINARSVRRVRAANPAPATRRLGTPAVRPDGVEGASTVSAVVGSGR